MKSSKKLIIAAIIIGLIIAVRFSNITHLIDVQFIQRNKDYVQMLIVHNYFTAVVSYILISFVMVFLTIPLTPLLTMGAGFFFGVSLGMTYSLIGQVMGATLSCLMFRYLLRDFIMQRYGKRLEKFNREFANGGWNYLLALVLFPVTPFAVVIALIALSTIPIIKVIGILSVGTLPSVLFYSFAGRQIMSINALKDIWSPSFIMAIMLLALLALFPLLLRIIKKKRK